MPGNVTALSGITTAYPFTTFSAFSVSMLHETAIAEYPDGSSQRRNKADNPRRAWSVSHRLTAVQAVMFRAFYLAHLVAPFKFTDISDDVERTAVFTAGCTESRDRGDRFTFSVQILEAA